VNETKCGDSHDDVHFRLVGELGCVLMRDGGPRSPVEVGVLIGSPGGRGRHLRRSWPELAPIGGRARPGVAQARPLIDKAGCIIEGIWERRIERHRGGRLPRSPGRSYQLKAAAHVRCRRGRRDAGPPRDAHGATAMRAELVKLHAETLDASTSRAAGNGRRHRRKTGS